MSTKLLHLDSSILGAQSVSRTLSASVVAKLTAANPALTVTYRDLAAQPLPHLSGGYLAAASGQVADEATQADLALGSAVIEEFLGTDIVVLGFGFYNSGRGQYSRKNERRTLGSPTRTLGYAPSTLGCIVRSMF